MVLVRVNLLPIFIPVEHFYGVVIGAGEHIGLRWMYHDVSDVVCVLLYCLNFLGSVVVENAKFVVVRAHNNPLFACNKLSAAHRRVSYLESTYWSLGIIVINYNCASVERDDNPWQGGVQVDGFYTFGSVKQLFFNL